MTHQQRNALQRLAETARDHGRQAAWRTENALALALLEAKLAGCTDEQITHVRKTCFEAGERDRMV